jgi:hypothetical protein
LVLRCQWERERHRNQQSHRGVAGQYSGFHVVSPFLNSCLRGGTDRRPRAGYVPCCCAPIW